MLHLQGDNNERDAGFTKKQDSQTQAGLRE
jgi:hypothetical protein